LKLQSLHGQPRPDLLTSIAEDVSLLPPDVLDDAGKKPSVNLALSQALAEATPQQLTQLIGDLAPQMKNRRNRPSAFLKIDLPDFIEARGIVSLGEGGKQILVEEYRQRVEIRVLEIVANHPALDAIRLGQEVSDAQLVDLERILNRDLAGGDLQVSPANIKKAYGLKVDNFLAFVRHVLALETLPDYGQVVQRAFERFIADHHYNADQIRFLRSVQEVFLKKRSLVEADLYEPPLTVFGRNAVERFFTPHEIRELLELLHTLAA
jgi:type I restriction enzyme R subunit